MAVPQDSVSAITPAPQRDMEQARSFLEWLDPSAAEFTFQTFDDVRDAKGKPRKDGSLARVLNGTLEECCAELQLLNDRGAGVFVTINETDLNGRKAANIRRVRAVFVDADTPEAVVNVKEAIRAARLMPSAIVQSSPRKSHCYWLVDDLRTDEFTAFQQAMIGRWGTDSSVDDLPRVMRLPGFLHRKGVPQLVRLTHLDRTRRIYGKDELARGFGLELTGGSPARSMVSLGAPAAPLFRGLSAGDLGGAIPPPLPLELDAIRGAALALPVNRAKNGVEPLASEGWWKKVAMAFAAEAAEHPEAAEELYAILDEVSRQPGAGNHDPETNRKSFDYFVRNTPKRVANGAKVVGLGTVFEAAEKVGWVRPAPKQLLQQPPPAPTGPFPAIDAAHAPAVPGKRRWLYANDLARGYVTLLTAPGGAGKTALAVGMALSLATGGKLLGDWVHSRLRVLLVNGEDSADEMWLRVHGAAQHYKLNVQTHLGGYLHVLGADADRVRLVTVDAHTRMPAVDRAAVTRLEETMRVTGADVLVLDPMVRLTEANENDAGAADMLAAELTGLAIRRNAAVLALHHNRKGARADVDGADAARGSTATTAAARVALGISTLRKEEATDIGVPPDDARRYFSLDNAKANLAPLSELRWFRLASATVPNADPAAGYPDGDNVQVVVPYKPRPPSDLVTAGMRLAALRVIHRGVDDENGKRVPLSPSANAAERHAIPRIASAFGPLMPKDSGLQCEQMAKATLGELIKEGAVREVTALIPTTRRSGGNKRKALEAVWKNTPWSAPDDEDGAGAAGGTQDVSQGGAQGVEEAPAAPSAGSGSAAPPKPAQGAPGEARTLDAALADGLAKVLTEPNKKGGR